MSTYYIKLKACSLAYIGLFIFSLLFFATSAQADDSTYLTCERSKAAKKLIANKLKQPKITFRKANIRSHDDGSMYSKLEPSAMGVRILLLELQESNKDGKLICSSFLGHLPIDSFFAHPMNKNERESLYCNRWTVGKYYYETDFGQNEVFPATNAKLDRENLIFSMRQTYTPSNVAKTALDCKVSTYEEHLKIRKNYTTFAKEFIKNRDEVVRNYESKRQEKNKI